MQPARVLVVEDNQVFSRLISLTVQQEGTYEVVGVVTDGLSAVRSAEDLQPDLVLLDIGLPKQNGIEAGRQIRRLAPRSKIVFVSQESSPTVIWRALDLGAFGYVLKIDVATELLAAMNSAREDVTYVSAGCRDALAGAVLSGHRSEMDVHSVGSQDETYIGI